MTSASEQTSASLPDDCQDYLGGNEPCALAPGNCKKCANPKQQPDTKIKTVSWEEYQSLYRDYYDMGLKVESLQKFKDYVHKRLDDAGVPVDPESPHKAAGCRIGGRLDLVLGQPDELSKEAEHWKKRWEVQCEAVDVAQTSVTNLHFELSKAQARGRWREIAVDGLPGEKYHGKWVELLKFKPIYSQPPVLFFRQWFDIDDPARYTLSKIYTHWREIELPS